MKEDILTGFYTREELIPYLNKLINENTPFTVGLIDLNGFKKYNDKYGHAFGDEILKYVASTLKLTIGALGKIFRLGGDEFLVVFPKRDKRAVTNIFKLCNRHLYRRPFLSGNRLYKLSASYGIASYPYDGNNPKQLISLADKAMYFSKKKRKKGSITDVRKIPIVKLRIFVTKILIVGIIIAMAGYFVYHTKLASLLQRFKGVVTRYITGSSKSQEQVFQQLPQCPVMVTLRNGYLFKGRIISQDQSSVTLEVQISGRKGRLRIDRSLILEVR